MTAEYKHVFNVCVNLQGVGAELGLQQPPPLQEEHSDVEGVHI